MKTTAIPRASTGRPRLGGGFSLSEIIIALGLMGVAILAVVALSFSSLASSRKSSDTQTGTLVARQVLETQVQEAMQVPTAMFWTQNSASSPYSVQNVTVGSTAYQARLFITTVVIPSDATAPNPEQLKRVEVVVNWWDSQTVQHPGYGKLEAHSFRVLNVP